MHPSAYQIGRLLFNAYWRAPYRRILDIGSLDVNGSLRDFCPEGAEYVGVDMGSGKGVDLVLQDPYSFPFPDSSFDLIVSSSCFEHDGMFWLTLLEASRVLSPGGILYINAPANGQYHAYPRDNWRFYPDAGLALQEWAQRSGHDMHLTESFIANRIGPVNLDGANFWSDCVMIFSKGKPDSGAIAFVSDAIHETGLVMANNVRRFGDPEVRNYSDASHDMIEIQALNAELRVLRTAYQRLSAESAPVLAASYAHPVCAGSVQKLRQNSGGGLLEGWAWDPVARKPARFVVLVIEGRAAASAAACLPRSDAAVHSDSGDSESGFSIPISDDMGTIGPHRCKLLAFGDAFLGELRWAPDWTVGQRE